MGNCSTRLDSVSFVPPASEEKETLPSQAPCDSEGAAVGSNSSVPSLLELCIEVLCDHLVKEYGVVSEQKTDEMRSSAARPRSASASSLFPSHASDFSIAITMGFGMLYLTSMGVPGADSVVDDVSRQFVTSNRPANPSPLRSTMDLPPSILQMLFSHMAKKRVLNPSLCSLFMDSKLSSINLAGNAKVNSEWLDSLLGSNHRLTDFRLLQEYEVHHRRLSSPERFKSYLDMPSPLTESLTCLDLSFCTQFNESALRPIARCKSLKVLNLQGTPTTDTALSFILPGKDLHYLNVAGCKELTDVSLAAARHMLSLETFIVDACGFTDVGASYLCNWTRLLTFSAGWCPRLTHASLGWLKNNKQLTELNLAHTGCATSEFYAGLSNLTSIDVSGTKIGDGTLQLSGLFPRLGICRISHLRSLADFPLSFIQHTLQELDLSFVHIPADKMVLALTRLAETRPLVCQYRRKTPPSRNSSTSPAPTTTSAPPSRHPITAAGSSLPVTYSHSRIEEGDLICECRRSTMDQCRSEGVSISNSSLPPELALSSMPERPSLNVSSDTLMADDADESVVCSAPCSACCCDSPSLRILRLESCAVTDAAMKIISRFSKLEELNIADTEVTNDGLKYVRRLKHLTRLNCNGTKINNLGCSALFDLCLKELRIDCASVSDGGLVYVRSLQNLEILELFQAQVTDAGLEHIAPLSKLKSLEVCSGRITNQGLAKLWKMKSLTNLNLSQNPGINDAGLSALCHLRSLTHLNLSHTSISPKGLMFLRALPYIQSLSLFGCKIKSDSPQLRALPGTVHLGLDDAPLTL